MPSGQKVKKVGDDGKVEVTVNDKLVVLGRREADGCKRQEDCHRAGREHQGGFRPEH